jgi:hypothetical protein
MKQSGTIAELIEAGNTIKVVQNKRSSQVIGFGFVSFWTSFFGPG